MPVRDLPGGTPGIQSAEFGFREGKMPSGRVRLSPFFRTPITRSRKIYFASYQCVPAAPRPAAAPAVLSWLRVEQLLASISAQLAGGERPRVTAFRLSGPSNRSVPQDGIRLACRSPRAPSFQAQRACAGLDGRVNKFVTFHPTGKRGSGGPPGHCELGPAVVQCGASGDQRKASRLRLYSALRFCSFKIPPKTPTHVRHNCARANHAIAPEKRK